MATSCSSTATIRWSFARRASDMKKFLIALSISLVGCSANVVKTAAPTQPGPDAFLAILKGVLDPGRGPSYDSPITKENWEFVSDIEGIRYYIEKRSLKVDPKTRVISFKTLYDSRKFKKTIMDEFGYSEYFDSRIPPFVTYTASVDCINKKPTNGVRQVLKEDMTAYDREHSDRDKNDSVLIRNSISDSLCFALEMYQY